MTTAVPPQPNSMFSEAQRAVATPGNTFARKLREETVAVRLRVWKMGTKRALTDDQKRALALEHGADLRALSASKRLLDTKHPVYKRVRGLLTNTRKYWESVTVPYPESGVRLMRRSRIEEFREQMQRYQDALDEALVDLEGSYEALRLQARNTLGDLYQDADYPTRIDEEFAFTVDYPSIEPPRHLQDVHPELYAQEQEKIQARFAESVRVAEESFTSQLHEMVKTLGDKLRGEVDGKPKTIRASTVENLKTFFNQFRELDIGSNQTLADLIDQTEQLVGGHNVEDYREDPETRASVAEGLQDIEAALSSMVVDLPTRMIQLPPPPPEVKTPEVNAPELGNSEQNAEMADGVDQEQATEA